MIEEVTVSIEKNNTCMLVKSVYAHECQMGL